MLAALAISTALAFAPAAAPIPTGEDPVATFADLDRDGRQDLIVAAGGTVTVHPSVGAARGPFTVGAGRQRDVQTADLDGDGRIDIVATGDRLSLLLARPDGGFTHVDLGPTSPRIAIADVDGDGRVDLIRPDSDADGVLIGRRQPGGDYAWSARATERATSGVSAADLDGDGRAEIVARHEYSGATILPGTGEAAAPDSRLAAGEPPLLRDLDADGRIDIAAPYGGFFSVWRGRPGGGFVESEDHLIREYAPTRRLHAADLDGDGRLDLIALAGSRLAVLPGALAGTFGSVAEFEVGAGPGSQALAVGDYDGDGRPDVVTEEPGGLRVRHNRTPPVTLSAPALNHTGQLSVSYAITAFRSAVASVEVYSKGPLDAAFSPFAVTNVREDGEYRFRVVARGHDLRPLESVAEDLVVRVDRSTTFTAIAPAFAAQAVQTAGEPRAVRITNTGPAALNITRVTGTDEFILSTNDCGRMVVAPGGTCDVTVTFVPAAAGERTGTLRIEALNAPAVEVAVSGIGVDAPDPPPIVLSSPAPVAPPAELEPAQLLYDVGTTGRKHTRLARLRLERVRPHTRITVRCDSGCPRRSLTRRDAYGTVSLASFTRKPLKAGTRIVITVTEPFAQPVRATITIRARRRPSVTTKLLPL